MKELRKILHYLGPFSPLGVWLSGLLSGVILWLVVSLVLYLFQINLSAPMYQ